jgi:hypothetical protein
MIKSVGASKGETDESYSSMFANQPALVNGRIKRELKVKDATYILKKEIKGS